jgi:hypothetical protein
MEDTDRQRNRIGDESLVAGWAQAFPSLFQQAF